MLTRREFIAGAAKVLAGGVAAASGVLAIVPKRAEHPVTTASDSQVAYSVPEYNDLVRKFSMALAERDGLIAPRKATYRLATKMTRGIVERIEVIDRGTLVDIGVDWEPQQGDFCPAPLFGIFLDDHSTG